MRILVLGSAGSMGRRYVSILKSLKQDVVGHDSAHGEVGLARLLDWVRPDAAIVATPTNTHYGICCRLYTARVDFLCEKPISKYPGDVERIANGVQNAGVDARMVCNWAWVFPEGVLRPREHTVSYNCYNTGRDGTEWDCIQLAYLARNTESLSVKTDSPVFKAEMCGSTVTLDAIARSYVRMIKAWLKTPDKLWDMQDAIKATEAVAAWQRKGGAR